MIKHRIFALAVAALSPVLAVDASAQAADPIPSDVHIESMSYNGSGCPFDSLTSSVTPDSGTLQLSFSEFFASAGPGIAGTESRKNCNLTFGMHVPQGWSYAVAAIGYGGYVTLDARVGATMKTNLYFSGQLAQAALSSSFVGPVDNDDLLSQEVSPESLVWSSCTEVADLNINMAIQVDNRANRRGSGRLTIDNVDTTSQFRLAWRRCP